MPALRHWHRRVRSTGSRDTRAVRRRRTDLNEREVVVAASRGIARVGVAGLTMRAVAAELGLSSMASY
ncbi:hypothetical protein CcI49_37785 [Frankia sp. CcI49]|uniref:hypothetical protein n=1 Tax=Frankia sp. CcI49 TaxID=1745382 RepID=UPI000975C229|nr:hypothetical protein [Frankia sp. CcI49]ONH50049.1 hypothetical protein CcI49_37785 [Frankia sp. CcI49]